MADHENCESLDQNEENMSASIAQPLDKTLSTEEYITRLHSQWLNEFLALSTEKQQDRLFELMRERLRWRILYYMRRHPERLTSGRENYTDRHVGSEEIMLAAGCGNAISNGIKWLDSHHIPIQKVACDHVILLNDHIKTLIACDSQCAILSLMRNFALSPDELEILASLVIAMSDEAILRLMVVAWADYTVRLPTVSFLSKVLSDTNARCLALQEMMSERGILRKMHLITAQRNVAFPQQVPLSYTPLSVDQIVIDVFCGRGHMMELPPNMTLHRSALSKHALVISKPALREIESVLEMPASRLCLIGPAHSGRRTVLTYASIRLKSKPVLEIDACRVFDGIQANEIDQRFAMILRESLLYGCTLLMRFDDLDAHNEYLQRLNEHQSQISRMMMSYPGDIVISSQKVYTIFDDIFNKPTCIHMPSLSVDVATSVWRRSLDPWCDPETSQHISEVFSRNYNLPTGSIFGIVRDAVEALHAVSGEDEPLQSHHILNEIRKSFRHQLGTLAEITVSDVPLSGVVLPMEARAQVDEILKYANNLYHVLETWKFKQRSPYGNALSVLFAGPPGTGKTLLASALANELGKVLYRVDLSRIVDKYIGETEKNLARIFDEAAKAQAIILFDEADSLFAKRTEVKSSNDRYANLEINYLLQKLESYNGMTILTTNLSKSIDEAFRRRLRFIIDFPMPDVSSRISLWQRLMPPEAPLSDDIRWAWLARTFEMSGGYIRNAVLKAAIAASADRSPISMKHLAKAAADEARSMGTLMRIDTNYDDYDDYDE